MTDEELVNITYDNGPEQLDEPNPAADLFLPDRPVSGNEGSDKAERERLIKYCVLASLILHVLAFTVVPRMSAFQEAGSAIKPGEKRTPVRLVQLPPAPKKEEPPPKQASAMSDRNHTAQKQRLPKVMPTPTRGPLGKIEPPKRMARLTPPPAPEHIEKQRQERRQPKAEKPRQKPKQATEKSPTEPHTRIAGLPRKQDFKNMKVDPRLTREDMEKAFSSQGGGSPDFFPDGDVEEAVVDINTREDRFYSYLMGLKRKIEGVWVYPRSAARAGIGGTLMLEFVIAKDGNLEGVNLLDSCGHALLDQSALSAIRTAAPYNPFPSSIKAKRLRIRANFIYVTSDFFKRVMR